MSKQIGGNLPLTLKVNREKNLKNYRIYGTADGAGVQTENLWDGEASSLIKRQVAARGNICSALVITTPGTYTVKCFIGKGSSSTYIYGRKYTISTDTYGDIYYLALPTTAGGAVVTMTETVTADDIILIYDALHEVESTQIAAEMFTNMQLCVVSGSTAPVSYIPPGYKIPILNTSEIMNLWDGEQTSLVVRDAGSSGTRPSFIITTPGTYTIKCFVGKEGTETFVYGRKYTISTDTYGDIWYLALPEASGWTPQTVTETVTDDEIIIVYDALHTTVQSAATTFNRTELCIVKGSTPPDHYIPHRYTSNYDLFIGSSKLDEEEYVDYQEQKVYKRTENLCDVDDVELQALPNSTRYGLQYTTPGYYCIKALEGAKDDRTFLYAAIVNQNQEIIQTVNVVIPNNRTTANIALESGYALYLYEAYSTATKSETQQQLIDTKIVVLFDESSAPTAPSSYIPYLQPTDPPAPLPTINTYKGENTLSSSETTGKVMIDYGNDNISTIQLNNISYDIVDGSFYSIVADNYDSQQSYSKGDYCIYNYQLYKCNANTSGNWDSNKWILTNLTEWLRGD